MTTTVEVASSGQIILPDSARDDLGIETGQKYDLRILEGGILVLTPSQVRAVAALNEIREKLKQENASLTEMLAQLRRMREADA